MKKLLIIFGSFLALFMALALGISQLWPKAVPSEPYEVTQAKTAAQLAEIARNQESADFWQHFLQFVAIGLFGLMLTAGGVFIYWYASERKHAQRLDAMRFKRSLSLIDPDANGNYPAWLDPERGEIIRARPGNAAYPAQYHFVNGSQPQSLQEPQRRSPGNRSLTTRSNGRLTAYYSASEVIPEQIEAPAQGRNVNVNLPDAEIDLQLSNGDLPNLQPEIYSKFTDILPQIETLVKEGRGKTEGLKALGLGGRHYKEASQIWDELAAKVAKEG